MFPNRLPYLNQEPLSEQLAQPLRTCALKVIDLPGRGRSLQPFTPVIQDCPEANAYQGHEPTIGEDFEADEPLRVPRLDARNAAQRCCKA